ncbi:NAD(P)-dependent oxidoreductase [Nocardiopsis sp. CNT312]|uniref:NAD(P)-dependent oxidoreductase n=1 Tax=Nocardiopsis sp. CNT312 TaxID=1137268 RepID=UPI000491566D|nr:NAD(P)-binding domain-containing protein [Nocardiopsis sp. CNT312]
MTNTKPTVAVLGLGMMGAALTGALLRNGNTTTVWNRSAAKAEPLVAEGANFAQDVSDAVKSSEVIVVCVSTYGVVKDLLEPVASEIRGRVVVNLTSGTPEEARGMSAWAVQAGIRYLDGAIMGVPQMIGLPETLIFYGGPSDLFAEQEALLKVLGGEAVHLGEDAGVAMIYDLALLNLLWSSLTGYLQAQALVSTTGAPAEAFLPFAKIWMEQVVMPSIPESAGEVDAGSYVTDVSSLDVNKAAIKHLVDTCRELGVDDGMPVAVQKLIDKRVSQGHGNHSLASLFEALRQN